MDSNDKHMKELTNEQLESSLVQEILANDDYYGLSIKLHAPILLMVFQGIYCFPNYCKRIIKVMSAQPTLITSRVCIFKIKKKKR